MRTPICEILLILLLVPPTDHCLAAGETEKVPNLKALAIYAPRPQYPYEAKTISYGTETKVFGEPKLPDGTLARFGRNEGVRRMQTAERAAGGRLAGLRKPHHEPHRARVPDRAAGIEAISA